MNNTTPTADPINPSTDPINPSADPKNPTDPAKEKAQREKFIEQKLSQISGYFLFVLLYIIMLGGTDETTCTGTPYEYSQFAKWGFLGLMFVEIFILIVEVVVVPKLSESQKHLPQLFLTLIKTIEIIFVAAMYIYGCTALANKSTCGYDPLVYLLWFNVLMPGVIALILCCCTSCMIGLTAFSQGNVSGPRHIQLAEENNA